MNYLVFARWFGIVSVLLSLGILFNLDDARAMAKNMIRTETGYIMGAVLPIIFCLFALMFSEPLEQSWTIVVTMVGAVLLGIGVFRALFVRQWKGLMAQHIEQIPFLFSLFGLMFGVVLLYVGFIAQLFA